MLLVVSLLFAAAPLASAVYTTGAHAELTWCPNIDSDLDPHRATLKAHPIYTHLNNEINVKHFMASHVFAVWDFQSLVKELQRRLTTVKAPWFPTEDKESRRLMNEIVTDEESDEHPLGGYASHLEIYKEAMESVGADTEPITRWLKLIMEDKISVIEALDNHGPWPPGVDVFVRNTFNIINGGKSWEIAAAFTKGREDVIPTMFIEILKSMTDDPKWDMLKTYLSLHVKTDGERHGPMAQRMFNKVLQKSYANACNKTETNECDYDVCTETIDAAVRSLGARASFWNEVMADLPTQQKEL